MSGYFVSEINQRYYRERSTRQIGYLEGSQLCYVSSQNHSDSDAYIPGGEVGAGGCTPLVVGRQIDEQGVVGREHGAESDSRQ